MFLMISDDQRSFHSGSDGQTESEAVPAYGQPGLDYSLQRHPTRDPIYPAHHMMQHPAAVAAAGRRKLPRTFYRLPPTPCLQLDDF